MAQIELCNFTEVAQLLGVDFNTVNRLIQEGKLQPIRSEAGSRFRRSDVEAIRKESQKPKPKGKYSWDDVLRELQIEEKELQNLISDGEIQVYLEQGVKKFDIEEIERYKNARQVEMTIVVEKNLDQNEEVVALIDEDDYAPPKSLPAKAVEPPKPIIKPSPAKPPVQMPTAMSKPITPPVVPPPLAKVAPKKPEEQYYNQDEVLTKLQIEVEELLKMLDDGEISAFPDSKGKPRFKKAEIDFIRNSRMVDATMVVESTRHGEFPSNDEIRISNGYSNMIDDAPEPLSFSNKQKFVLDDSLPPSKPMANKNMTPIALAIPVEDDEIIDAIVIEDDESPEPKKAEATVILPDFGEADEDNKNLEETMSMGGKSQNDNLLVPQTHYESMVESRLTANKPFYSFAEVAQILGESLDLVKIWITKLKIAPYIQNNDRKIKHNDFLALKKAIEQSKAPQTAIPIAIEVPTPAENPLDELCPLEEVQKILQVNQQTLKIMVAKGQLVAKKIGNKYYFERKAVMNLAGKMSIPSTTPQTISPSSSIPSKTSTSLNPIPTKSVSPPIPPKPTVSATATKPASPTITKTSSVSPTAIKPPLPKPASPISAQPSSKPQETYTVAEAMKLLAIGRNDIQRLVDEKHITLLPGNLIQKSELDGLKKRGDVEITMVLPLSSEQAEDENEAPVILSAPKAPIRPIAKQPATATKPIVSAPAPKPPVGATKPIVSTPAPKPPVGATKPIVSAPAPKPTTAPTSSTNNIQNYYTLQQTLMELQLDTKELNELVKHGSLKCFASQGKQYFKKQEVDGLKKEKMIEPTIMMGQQGDGIIIE